MICLFCKKNVSWIRPVSISQNYSVCFDCFINLQKNPDFFDSSTYSNIVDLQNYREKKRIRDCLKA